MKRPRPRPELSDLTPYKTSDTESGRVWLHANENPYPPPESILDEIFATARAHSLNRYPPDPSELIAELASYAGVDPSWVWIGDGANEVLLQACLAYGGPERTAMLFEPTYRMHHRQARMAGTEVVACLREPGYEIDAYAAVEAIEAAQPDIVFVCTPNNPTGTVTPQADLELIASTAPGLVVIDEAYFEFIGQTFVGELERHGNVLVTRTLSKAFRLASIRLGYGIAHPDVLAELRRVRMPYAQSAFTAAAGTVALRRRSELLDAVPRLIAERERLAAGLSAGGRVYPSGANFLLFEPTDADALLARLGEREIVVRDFRHLSGCEGCVRISVGTPEENDAVLEAVSAFGR